MNLKNLLLIGVIFISFSHTVYSLPSLTGIVTGLSRACASIVMPLAGIAPYNATRSTLAGYLGSLVEKPIQIDDATRAKLKVKLVPEIDLDEYHKDIYVSADALGRDGTYVRNKAYTNRSDEKLCLSKHITLPVDALQKHLVSPCKFRWDYYYKFHWEDGYQAPTGKLTEESGALLTDEDLDICCAYIKRDIQFEKSGVINRSLSKLPLPLALLPTICTPLLYYADKKLTTSFASSITKSLIAAPARIAVAASLGVALAGIGNIASYRIRHHVEEEKDKYIDQKDVPLFKKHLEATLKHVQSGKRVEYNPWIKWFDKFPRYRALVDSMQQESLERRVKALALRSEIGTKEGSL
jgi:hypothetical protein